MVVANLAPTTTVWPRTASSPMFSCLAPLENYGGTTQTMGSVARQPSYPRQGVAIAGITTLDQPRLRSRRSQSRHRLQSQGFLQNIVSGNNQSTQSTTAFNNPLVVSVTANNPVEPVNGGVVTLTVSPAADGARATLSSTIAMIAGGQVGVNATANSVAGTYAVAKLGQRRGYACFFDLNEPGGHPDRHEVSATLAAPATASRSRPRPPPSRASARMASSRPSAIRCCPTSTTRTAAAVARCLMPRPAVMRGRPSSPAMRILHCRQQAAEIEVPGRCCCRRIRSAASASTRASTARAPRLAS